MMSVSCGNQVVSMACLDCGLKLAWQLQILRFPCYLHVISMVSIWTPCDFKCRHHMVSNVDTIWFPHGHHMVSIWTLCGVQETTWKPAEETALHEGVRKFAVFAFCVLCLCLAFCVLCLEAVFSNIMFFSIKSLS